ncbi:MAG: IgGFc-binding protein, partial [Prevotellaceae bacterium]|nr:IgGFc-binding protein [Prevotellaceae bacterium]
MKTILSTILIAIMFFSFSEKIYAQATSTQGTDFWLSFGRNRNNSYNSVNLQVRVVTGNADANVTFTYTESGMVNTVNILAGSVYTHALTNTEKNRVYSFNTGTSSKSLHIESDVPVSVYALNQVEMTTDATNVLPITSLGTDYYHISYKSNSGSYNDGYTLIATEDNTDIYEDGILQTSLQKGEVYSGYFGATDVTGKHITSNNPIAYFVTNGGVWLPYNLTTGADCFFQQLVSVNKWGNNFLVPITHRGIERIRIIASQDGTVITQTGGVIKTDNGGFSQNSLNLDKGQFVELEASLNTCGCYITSNKPVGVCTYLVGMAYHPPVEKGDPSISWVPPIEQSINGALIAPFIPTGNSVLDEHYALIVTPTATKDQTTMAIGTNLATGLTGGNWCDNTSSNFSFYSLPLYNTSDAYYFANPYGLTVMGYGIGDYESYYYLSGAASRDLDAAFYINNTHYQDLDGSVICDTNVNFRAAIQYAMNTTPGYLKWYIDGTEQIAVRDTLEWSGTLSIGSHNVYIEVLDMEDSTITLSATFDVGLAYHHTIDTTICLGEEYHDDNFDTIPTQAGSISLYKSYPTAIVGCDSVFTLNLTVNPSYYDTVFAEICAGDHYFYTDIYDDTIFDVVTSGQITIIQTHKRYTSYSCDSFLTLHLTVHPIYDYPVNTAICLGDTCKYPGFDTVPTQPGYYPITHNYTTIHGCDSIVRLNLYVRPSYHDTIRTSVCLGKTYSDSIFGNITPTQIGTEYYSKKSYTKTYYCDSIKILELTAYPTYDYTIYESICLGEEYEDDNFYKKPTQFGIITDSINIPTTIGGCDSIIRLHLTVNPSYHDTIYETICLGDRYFSYNFDETPTQAGNFTFIHDEKTTKGCDSITTLLLTVNISYHDTVKATICLDDFYNDYLFEIIPTTSGFFTYIHDDSTSNNCDSITVLQLTINPIYDEYISARIYEDEFYT